MTKSRESANFSEMCNLLLKMKELKYEDLTFTGGEPLVAMNDLLRYLDFMEENEYTPDITVVTNGYLIYEKLIERIKRYKGDFKFNFSMHSVDKESYFDIVRPVNNNRDAFDVVMKNIKLLKENNIKMKMNFVLLKGINCSKEYIKKY